MEKSALFINKLVEDKEFQSALGVAAQKAVTKEEKIAATTKFANEAGFEVSSDELQKYVESIQNESNLLSDDDLDNVAGGAHSETGETIGEIAGLGAGTAAGTAIGGPTGGVVGGAAGAVVGGYVGGTHGEAIAGGAQAAGGAVADTAKQVFSGW